MPVKTQRNPVHFPYAIRSFIGYLEGTQKSAHTIKNYKLDLLAFQEFIRKESGAKSMQLEKLDRRDLEQYREYLKEKGLKTNTRRRKILTVTQFMGYLAKRKKVGPEIAQKLATPHKIERVPVTVSSIKLIETILQLPHETFLDARNRALLGCLAETGCLVSEVTHFRFEQFVGSPEQNFPEKTFNVQIQGKAPRTVPVSKELFQAIQDLKKFSKDCPWIFLGFNKFGPLGAPISARGVELLVRLYGPRLGFEGLTPRIFRHSIVLKWTDEGLTQSEIQQRLGLKTAYAFLKYQIQL